MLIPPEELIVPETNRLPSAKGTLLPIKALSTLAGEAPT